MFFINPFIYGGAAGDYESIATVTVGSGGASSIEFTSIPGTYQHLQVRAIWRCNETGNTRTNVMLEVNGTATSSKYANHMLRGNGSAAQAFGFTSSSDPTNKIIANISITTASAGASIFGAGIVDLLDYASTSKTRVFRTFSGADVNTEGSVYLGSLLFDDTAAVTSLRLTVPGFNFVQHTTAALYGIKAP